MSNNPKTYYQFSTSTTPIVKCGMYSAAIGSFVGLAHHVFRGNQMCSNAGIGHMLRGGFVIGGLGFFFASGRYVLAKIRNKHDWINNAAGVCAIAPLCRQYMSMGLTHNFLFAMMFISTAFYCMVNDYTGEKLDERVRLHKRDYVLDLRALLRKPKGVPYIIHTPNSFF